MANLAKSTALSSATTLADNAALAARADGYFALAQVSGSDTVIDNAADRNLFLNVEFELGAAAWPAGGWIDLYLVSALDGANYDTGSTSVLPGAHARKARLLTHGNTTALSSQAVQLSAHDILVPPGKFKLLWLNKTGTTTAATGNAATAWFHNRDLNG